MAAYIRARPLLIHHSASKHEILKSLGDQRVSGSPTAGARPHPPVRPAVCLSARPTARPSACPPATSGRPSAPTCSLPA